MGNLFELEKEENTRRFSKYAKRVVCILLAVGIILGVSIFSVEAWRTKIMNFVFESDAPNTDYSFGENMQQKYVDEYISLNYIPSGFELTEKYSSELIGDYFFMKGNIGLHFSYASINTESSVDTENGTVEAMVINGMEAVYVSTPRINSLVWHDDKNSFIISSTISKEEIVKIAENSEKL